jgi:hypothetical protein
MPELSHIKMLVAGGDQEAAIVELVRLLRTDSQNIEAWLLLADLREDPQERKDCYKRVLKLDPYNEQAQLQMRVLGGTTSLKLNRPDQRKVEPPPPAAPLSGVTPLPGVIEMPEHPESKPAPPMESSSVAPEMLLRSLRTELAPADSDSTAARDGWLPATDEDAQTAPARGEGFKDLPGKMKPLPGRFVRFTAKNRPTQILLIVLGIALVLVLFLIVWSRVIPILPPATLIVGPAKKYIPAQAALPAGFTLLETPASDSLISLPDKGEGYRMVFTNPDFAAQHRETSVTYEVVVFNNEVDAQVSLLAGADVNSYSAAGKTMETDAVAPTLLARVDASALLFGRKDQTLNGTPAISYTLLLREVNLFARITVSAPVADVESTQAQNLRGPLYQAVFYYASLLTAQLPLPAASQVTVSPPVFPAIP